MGSLAGSAGYRLLLAVIGSGALLGVAGVLSAAASTFVPVGTQPALEVGTVVPTVTTAVRNASGQIVTSIPFGESFHDSAVVSGGSGTPTGTVTFRLFGNGTCSGTAEAVSGAFTLRGGSVDATSFGFNGAVTTYAFQATYSGNATYAKKKGACEPITVVKAQPSIATEVRAAGSRVSTVAIGTQVHDYVKVTGNVGGAVPSGTVTIRFFRDGTCSTVVATSAAEALVHGAVDATAFKFSSNHPTLLSFRATYNGDAGFTKRTGACEPVSVKALPTVAASAIDFNTGHAILTAPYGDFMVARVKVSGSWGTPTGTVKVSLFSEPTCSTPEVGSTTLAMTNGSLTVSPVPDPRLKPGTYAYLEHYFGDTTYESLDGPCVSFGVEPAPAVLTASVQDAGGRTVASVPVGTIVHVHAVVSGAFGTPTGKVTDVLLLPGCQGAGLSGSATLSGGSADITSRTATATQVGTNIAFSVGYGGDALYGKTVFTCVEVGVTAASSTPKPATAPPASAPPAPTPPPSLGALETPGSSAGASPGISEPAPSGSPSAAPIASPAAAESPVPTGAPTGSAVATGPDPTIIVVIVLLLALLLVAVFLRLGRSPRSAA